MSNEPKTIELNDYIKKMRTNLLLVLEGNKETTLKVFDEMSANLYKAYGQIEMLKTKVPKETVVEKPNKKKK